jgi:hypothetical protein
LTPLAFSALARPAGLGEQLAVGDLGDLGVVGLEDQRDLVAEAGLDLAVEAVVRRVQGAVLEPLEERRLAVVEHLRERRLPAQQLAREAGPVAFVVGFSLGRQFPVGLHTGDVRAFDGGFRRRVQIRGDGVGHGRVSSRFGFGSSSARVRHVLIRTGPTVKTAPTRCRSTLA